MAPKATVSAPAALLDRKPPSTSSESAGILARRHEPPRYLRRAAANSCPATPTSAELSAIRHTSLDPHTCWRDRWNPSFLHKYPAVAADTPHFRYEPAASFGTHVDDQVSAHQASASRQFHTSLVAVPALHRHPDDPSASQRMLQFRRQNPAGSARRA